MRSDSPPDRYAEIMHRRATGSPYYQLLGMKIERLAEGESRFSLDIEQKHRNMAGILHGGVVASIADASMGVALATLTDPEAEAPVTVEIKVNYLAPVHEGKLETVGTIRHKGNTVAVGTCEVRNADDGSLVAIATATFMIRRRPDDGRQSPGAGGVRAGEPGQGDTAPGKPS